MDKPNLIVKGSNATVSVFDDRVSISHKKLINNLHDEKVIYFKDITYVDFKKANPMINGYIHFATNEEYDLIQQSYGQMLKSPNTIIFKEFKKSIVTESIKLNELISKKLNDLNKNKSKVSDVMSKPKMGILANTQRGTSANEYDKKIKPMLKHDGRIHVVMINSFSKWLDQNFGIESKYTNQIDEIISRMQHDEFEILDIKFDSLQNQGLLKDMEGFHTLITYK